MTNALSTERQQMAIAQPATAWMTPTNLEQGLKLAEMIADCGLVPDHLAKKPGACLMIMAQAAKWGMDPLSVAQCTSTVHGKLMYEGKLVHAALLSMNAVKHGSEEIEFFEKPGSNERGIKLTATLANGKSYTVVGTVGQWKTESKFWKTQPDDQLIYRAWRTFARRHAPAALLGVHTPEEAIAEQETEVRIIQDPAIAASFLENVQKGGLDEFLTADERAGIDSMSYGETKELYSELVRRKNKVAPKAANPAPKKTKPEPVDAQVKDPDAKKAPPPAATPEPEPPADEDEPMPEPPPADEDSEEAFN